MAGAESKFNFKMGVMIKVTPPPFIEALRIFWTASDKKNNDILDIKIICLNIKDYFIEYKKI